MIVGNSNIAISDREWPTCKKQKRKYKIYGKCAKLPLKSKKHNLEPDYDYGYIAVYLLLALVPMQ
jgi:hypothetical protein